MIVVIVVIVVIVLIVVVDCPTQLTLVIWICQLSRRWGPFKRGSKIFGAFLQPGKDIWGQFFLQNIQGLPINMSHNKKLRRKGQKPAKNGHCRRPQSHPCNEEQTFYTPVTAACCVPQQIPVRNMIERTQQENLLRRGPPLVMLRFWTKTS